jgi:hypothetical protein
MKPKVHYEKYIGDSRGHWTIIGFDPWTRTKRHNQLIAEDDRIPGNPFKISAGQWHSGGTVGKEFPYQMVWALIGQKKGHHVVSAVKGRNKFNQMTLWVEDDRFVGEKNWFPVVLGGWLNPSYKGRRLPNGVRGVCHHCGAVVGKEERTRRLRICRPCKKITVNAKSFGLSIEEYKNKQDSQRDADGVLRCAISGLPENGKSLSLDHDHRYHKKDKRGHRGLIMEGMNWLVAEVENHPERIKEFARSNIYGPVVKYLKKWEKRHRRNK